MTQVVEKVRVFGNCEIPEDRDEDLQITGDDGGVSHARSTRATMAHRYLLALRFAVFNLAALALLGAAYMGFHL